ncbi:MAG: DUF736 family protein [Bradyrhizobium sp.]|nr:DUF736 family protein [Bradyrhizobium sp.]
MLLPVLPVSNYQCAHCRSADSRVRTFPVQSRSAYLCLFSDVCRRADTNRGRPYLSVKLDDPSFTGPIYANLIEDEGGKTHTLIWSRPSGSSQ